VIFPVSVWRSRLAIAQVKVVAGAAVLAMGLILLWSV